MAEHNDFGKESEEEAVLYLENLGYEILVRNFYWQSAEIDIIAKYNNILIIVEVKSRRSAYYGEPYSFVNPQKMKLLAKATNHYININNLDMEVRFDIISIIKNNTEHHLEHIEDAFYPF
ncbi:MULTISPECIES: YraN family protein [unclassified Capnocytophaga]|jgi:Predicted endonuclease distantly related to archaeal Holliday junction resolvase|uniref:YraN family protein n=1 Tax=unclassified Capnocytophaga TaxID=2640652 RepID=UPI000202CBEF|nr:MULTISPECIES: YraN family protein [unclassified Capnocytophaga]EGD33943.1 endonuclease [Capnocytophaga sp. oral taxon 338 str. F0234]MEB3004298.1 YraN family protein [Capnocytophaga sp. G2]